MNKAQWAQKKADELRGLSRSMRYRSSQGSYSKAARKGESMRRLDRLAAKFERIARAETPAEEFELPF